MKIFVHGFHDIIRLQIIQNSKIAIQNFACNAPEPGGLIAWWVSINRGLRKLLVVVSTMHNSIEFRY